MKIIATICARGGSVGVPRKNIRLLHGLPLIAYSIRQALASPSIDAVYVSTDDEEIAEVARLHGARVPFLRPAALATSVAPKLPVIEHLCDWVESNVEPFDRIIDLDPTSPLRTVDDIETCNDLLDDETDGVITVFEAEKNPYFNMVERKTDGNVRLVCDSRGATAARQLAPVVYSMNASIYVWHRHTLKKGLWNGRLQMHIMPRERSVDIDSPLDFEIVKMLMLERGEPEK